MIGWIRVDTAIEADPKIGFMADHLGVDEATVVGHLVFLWGKMAAHAKDGDLSEIPHQTLERWAAWRGERGKFSAAVRSFLCKDGGVMAAWDKHNGAPIRKAEADADRKRKAHEPPRDPRADLHATPEGTDGRTDGRDGRKDSVSNETGPKPAKGDVSNGQVLAYERKVLWAPDGKPPGDWTDARSITVYNQQRANGASGLELMTVIDGLRVLFDRGDPTWLRNKTKPTIQAVHRTYDKIRPMWDVAMEAGLGRPPATKGKHGQPLSIADLLPKAG